MKKFDISAFLNKFYKTTNKNLFLKKIWICLKFIYGLNIYSASQICFLFGINISLINKVLSLNDWVSLFGYFKLNFNFSIYDMKFINVKNIRSIRSYRGWRHIFNLPVNGQRSHTNAKTRKKYKIY